jgi:uncharacterized integral membrane protein
VKVKLAVWGIAFILVLIFVIGNAEPMELLFIKRFSVSKIVVILVSLAIGFIAGLLVEGRKKSPKIKKKIEKEESNSN